MPPSHRLACQCFIRDEDIEVVFEGDVTVPVKGPALSLAAAIYKGGVGVRTLDQFLSYAVKVEEDAAVHFEALANAMTACGNAFDTVAIISVVSSCSSSSKSSTNADGW